MKLYNAWYVFCAFVRHLLQHEAALSHSANHLEFWDVFLFVLLISSDLYADSSNYFVPATLKKNDKHGLDDLNVYQVTYSSFYKLLGLKRIIYLKNENSLNAPFLP